MAEEEKAPEQEQPQQTAAATPRLRYYEQPPMPSRGGIGGFIDIAGEFISGNIPGIADSPLDNKMDEGEKSAEEGTLPATGFAGSRTSMAGTPDPDYIKWDNKKKGAPAAHAYLTGQTSPQLSAEEQQAQAFAQEQLFLADQQAGYAFLQARRATQRELQAFAYLSAENAEAVGDLVNNRFPEFYKKQEKLEKELDDIRTMRVNPYNYLQQAGVGGRAASVLATAVSQIAAGAGGINPAMAAIKSAIERDISAQESNIELAYRGIAAGQANLGAQLEVMKEEVAFREKAMAMAWQAVETIASSNMMAAQNEAAYIGLRVMHHKVTLEKLAAKEAWLAKTATIVYKYPLMQAFDAARSSKKVIQFQNILNQAFQGGVQASQQMLQAQPTVGGQAAPSMPTAGGGVAVGGGAGAVPSARARRPTKTGAQEEAIAGAMSSADAPMPEPTESYEQPLPETRYERGMGDAYFRNRMKYEQQMNPARAEHFLRMGGHDRGHAVSYRRNPDAYLTFGEKADKWLGRGSIGKVDYLKGKDRPATIEEAEDLALLAYETQVPKSEKERQLLEYVREYPESLMRSNAIGELGQTLIKNVIPTKAMGNVMLTAEGMDAAKFKEVEKDANQVSALVTDLKKANDIVEQIGLATSGATAVSPDGEFRPLYNTFESPMAQALADNLTTRLNDLAIKWIQQRDPAGRLSDQDIKFAQMAVGAIRNKRAFRMEDFADRFFSGDVPAATRALQMFWKMMAVDAIDDFMDNNRGSVVLPFDAYKRRSDMDEEVREWVQTFKKGKDGGYTITTGPKK